MATDQETATVLAMDASPAARGARIRERRLQMGWTVKAIAPRGGMGRDTWARVEADDPDVRAVTYAKAERALDELAAELGFDEAEQSGSLVRYEVKVPGVAAVTVSGPVSNLEELEASVARIVAMLHASEGHPEG